MSGLIFAVLFVFSFTYTAVDLAHRIGRQIDGRYREDDRWHQAHRR